MVLAGSLGVVISQSSVDSCIVLDSYDIIFAYDIADGAKPICRAGCLHQGLLAHPGDGDSRLSSDQTRQAHCIVSLCFLPTRACPADGTSGPRNHDSGHDFDDILPDPAEMSDI